METTRAGIAIYKINYQSDFILTVVCDVEWGTPFCIKFWTGEPSQAYYVGWDGNEYRNCKVVESDKSKLLVLFDDHHLPVGELKMQIAYHTTIEDFPNAIVDEVTNSMKVMAYIDGKNQKVALDFEGEEAAELQFELPAYANEAQRIANEQARIEAEQQRIDNEQTRQNNEAQRIAQETARVNEYAGLKADAVAATDAANDAATLANQKAQLAADKAALADAAATLANQKAQLAADKAALADAAATLANQKAEYADAQGDYAKEQGDYAKEQGDTALADHRRAESDHETAASDHTIAANDHTQAGNDHTRAESDHSTAADDHTLAASDHSTAAADHTLAASDHSTAAADHTLAASDHSTAAADHTLAASDHSTAADDHTQAGNDHSRAESDHTRAESDHAAVEVYVDSLGAFDISSYHETGGVLAKYADLTAALGTGGANIPEAIRKGGMSVKFVQSSDNKYIYSILTTQNWSTYTSDWIQVASVEEVQALRDSIFGAEQKSTDITNIFNSSDTISAYIDTDGTLAVSSVYKCTQPYLLKAGHKIRIIGSSSHYFLGSTNLDQVSRGSVVTPITTTAEAGGSQNYTAENDIKVVVSAAVITSIYDISPEIEGVLPSIEDDIAELETIADNTDYTFNVNKTVTTRQYEIIMPRWMKNGIIMAYGFEITSEVPESIPRSFFGIRSKETGIITGIVENTTINAEGHLSGIIKVKDIDFSIYDLVFAINDGNSILWKMSVNKVENYGLLQTVELGVNDVQKSVVQKIKAFITAQEGNDEYGQATVIIDGDSILGSQLEVVESVSGDVKEQPYNLDKRICARHFYDKYQWNNNVIFRRLDHSDWTKSGFSNARTISSSTNPNSGSYDFNNVLTFYGNVGDYGQIVVNGYSFFKLVWSDYGDMLWSCNVTVSIDGGNTFVVPSSLNIGQDVVEKTTGKEGNYDCACYILDPLQSYIFRITIASGASYVRFFGCEMWNGTRLNVIVEAASGSTARLHAQRMKWYLQYSRFKPLLYIWDILFFNDRSFIESNTYGLKEYSDYITEIVNSLDDVPIVALTPHPNSADTSSDTNKKITKFLLEMCESLRNIMTFVDIRHYIEDNKIQTSSYCSDGLHLNTFGNTMYFELLDKLFV